MRIIAPAFFLTAAVAKAQAQLINNIVSGCAEESESDLQTDYFPEKVR